MRASAPPVQVMPNQPTVVPMSQVVAPLVPSCMSAQSSFASPSRLHSIGEYTEYTEQVPKGLETRFRPGEKEALSMMSPVPPSGLKAQ